MTISFGRTLALIAVGMVGSVVMASTAKADVAWGWALGSNLTGTYTPLTLASYSSSGGAISIANTGTGLYTVTFAGLGAGATTTGNAQVGGFDDGSSYCNLAGYGFTGTSVNVYVSCYSAAGTLSNARFVAHYQRGVNSYIWTSSATLPVVSTCCSRNDAASAPIVSRSAVGKYTVFFQEGFSALPAPGGDPTATGGNAIATAYASNNHCKVSSWNPPDGVFQVFCFSPSGVAADTVFTMAAGVHGALKSVGHRYGYAFNSTSALYTPSGSQSLSENVVDYQRYAVGRYFTDHSGASVTTATLSFVNALNTTATYCKVLTWGTSGPSIPAEVDIDCYRANGTRVDEQYVEQLVSVDP